MNEQRHGRLFWVSAAIGWAVIAYGLMNEPAGFAPANGRTPAQVWEQASQAAVDAIAPHTANSPV